MRWFQQSGAARVAVWLGLGLALGSAVAVDEAAAASISATLNIQIAPQKTGSYGTVQVEEVSGGLEFTITLNSSLGGKADLNEFYFNLPDSVHGVRLSGSSCGGSGCQTPFKLNSKTSTKGGASSRFDFSVSFGNGASKKGNGDLKEATFRIDADAPLQLIPSPFDPSFTSRDLAVIFAAHVPGSKGVAATIGSTNATVIPEPGTAALLSLGLAGLAWMGRRRQ
jgi:hypothetical protein